MKSLCRLLSFALAGLLAASLAGCASYSGSSLVPGAATQAEVRQLMGEPAATHKGGGGANTVESWEYPRGPAGRHTYMVRFDARGTVTSIDQVLTVANTAKIAWGQSTHDDVRKILGRPGTVLAVRGGGEMWDYAAIATDGHPRRIRIVVSFDAAGRAVAGGESYDAEEFSPNADGGSSTQ